MARRSLYAPIKVIPNTTTVEAENLADLRATSWRVIGRRTSEVDGAGWVYVPGIEANLEEFLRLRGLAMFVMTQRREADEFVLLAKVANDRAGAWSRIVSQMSLTLRRAA